MSSQFPKSRHLLRANFTRCPLPVQLPAGPGHVLFSVSNLGLCTSPVPLSNFENALVLQSPDPPAPRPLHAPIRATRTLHTWVSPSPLQTQAALQLSLDLRLRAHSEPQPPKGLASLTRLSSRSEPRSPVGSVPEPSLLPGLRC